MLPLWVRMDQGAMVTKEYFAFHKAPTSDHLNVISRILGVGGRCPRGVMVKVMDCGIVVSKFVLQSRYYVHFRAIFSQERYEPPYLPSYGLNSTTTVLLGEWLWH